MANKENCWVIQRDDGTSTRRVERRKEMINTKLCDKCKLKHMYSCLLTDGGYESKKKRKCPNFIKSKKEKII